MKDETADNHLQLEKILIGRLKNVQQTIDYIRILSGFYGFIKPLENQLSPYLTEGWLPDFQNRRKSKLLLQDIQALGHEFSGEICRTLPSINSVYTAAGALYVLEGSTLGGQIISKILQKKLAFPDGEGLHYFNGYGNETHSRWETFTTALNSLNLTETEQDTLVQSANDTFKAFGTYLTLMNNV